MKPDDQVDRAIATAAAAETAPVPTVSFPLMFNGDARRTGNLTLPEDITRDELLAFISYVAGTVAPTVLQRQQPKSRLLVPRN